MAEFAILFDSTKCIACKGCQVACKQWNQNPARHRAKHWDDLPVSEKEFTGSYQNPLDLEPETYVIIGFEEKKKKDEDLEWFFARRACLHCTDAACEKVCPVKAISYTDEGFVVIDQEKCIGCRYCNFHCPFEIPKWSEENNKTYKCWFCRDRIKDNLKPACVTICPTSALEFDEREVILNKAKERKKVLGDEKIQIYGEDELEGLHVIYVLKDKPENYGLPGEPRIPIASYLWKDILKPVGIIAGGATVVGLAASFLANIGYTKEHGEEGE